MENQVIHRYYSQIIYQSLQHTNTFESYSVKHLEQMAS